MANEYSSDFRSARKVRVLIPTTNGVVEVLRIADERANYPRSTVRINLDMTKAAGIDAAYNEFVNSPSGLIERHYNHNRFRVDVSGSIDVGSSWQAGLMVAHALHASGRLAMRNEKGEGDAADAVVWITGELRIDHRVVRVGDVARKVQLSNEIFARLAAEELPTLICMPNDNALEVEVHAALTALGETDVRRFATLRDINEALIPLGLTPLRAQEARLPQWPGNPYRGLAVFDIEHAPIFCGRKDARERACATIFANADKDGLSFLLITGQSGSGKSSLARAGIVGDLGKARTGHWLSTVTTPQADPLASIDTVSRCIGKTMLDAGASLDASFSDVAREAPEEATAALLAALDRVGVRRGGATVHLIVVVDQLEEVLLGARTAGKDAGGHDVERYGRLLRCFAASRRIWIVATLRSDLFHLIDMSSSLASMVRETGSFVLPRPLQHELREIIRKPAMLGGATFEVENPQNRADAYSLADRIEQDAARFGDHPSLPLLEFALTLLFDRRSPQGIIQHKTYDEMGRLSGAIARYADQTVERAFDNADDRYDLEEALKWTLLNLSQIERLDAANRIDPPKARAVGNRMPVPDQADSAHRQVIDILVASRLVELDIVNGQSMARLAHDALFECWPRLSALVSNYRDDLLLRDELLGHYRHWVASDRVAWFLQADALEEARALKARWANNLDERLALFIDQSDTRARRLHRQWNWLRNGVAGLIAVSGLVAAAGWWQATEAFQSARANMVAAVEANRAVSDRALAIYYKYGLRPGAAQELIGDAADRLDKLSATEIDGAGNWWKGGAQRTDLLLALSATLLNFSEIELDQRGAAQELRRTRLPQVQSALAKAEALGATKGDVAHLRARLHLIQGNAAALVGATTEIVDHYSAALKSLEVAPQQDPFLRGRILLGLGNAVEGDVAEARQYFGASLQNFRSLPADRLAEVGVVREVLAAEFSLAFSDIEVGDHAVAIGRMDAALRSLETLAVEIRDAPAIKYEKTRYELVLAYAHRCGGHLDEAQAALKRNEALLQELLALDAENPTYLRDRAFAGVEAAEVLRAAGKSVQAQQALTRLQNEWATLQSRFPDVIGNDEQLSISPCTTGQ